MKATALPIAASPLPLVKELFGQKGLEARTAVIDCKLAVMPMPHSLIAHSYFKPSTCFGSGCLNAKGCHGIAKGDRVMMNLVAEAHTTH